MVRRRTLILTEDQHETLLAGRDHHPHPQVRERCAALLKIAAGMSPCQVAQQGLLRRRKADTVYGWLNRYQQVGIAGLLTHLQGGYYHRSRLRPSRHRGRHPGWTG